MSSKYHVEIATNDLSGVYQYTVESFNSLMGAAQYAFGKMNAEPLQTITKAIRESVSILRGIGLSENEIYDMTGDVDMPLPCYSDMSRMFREHEKWNYILGGTSPDYMRKVPLVWVKITKVEPTPRPQIDTLVASFQTMRV